VLAIFAPYHFHGINGGKFCHNHYRATHGVFFGANAIDIKILAICTMFFDKSIGINQPLFICHLLHPFLLPQSASVQRTSQQNPSYDPGGK
jgi:hypothetical protein